MAGRAQPSQLDKDADEFGAHVKAGGWRLGLLVARNVHVGEHGGDRSSATLQLKEKVTAAEFAKKAGVSERTVRNYYKAWELAADAGKVTHAAKLDKDSLEDLDQMEDDDETDENRRQIWRDFLRAAIRGNKKETPPAPKPNPRAPQQNSTPAETPEKEEEIDTSDIDSGIMSTALTDMLETTRVLNGKVKAVETILNERDLEVLDEIESEARELIETIELIRETNSGKE